MDTAVSAERFEEDLGPERSGRKALPKVHWGAYVVVALLAPLAGFGWYQYDGMRGLAAFGLGLAFGVVVVAVGRCFLRRQVDASGYRVVKEMMMGSFASVILFLIGTVLLAVVWKPALYPATFTALVLYLGLKFVEVLSVSTPRRDKDSEK